MEKLFINFSALIAADKAGIPSVSADDVLANGLNLVYFLAAVIAVIVVIIGGVLFATSAGNAASVTKAKNMILYAVVGLVVVLAAFAITNFVNGRFS